MLIMNIKHILSLIVLMGFAFPVSASMTTCRLTYNLEGWSVIYRQYSGDGFVTCNNGQQAKVSIISRSGGLTVGKSEINNGKGVFSEVKNINEIYGTYVVLDGHAGATQSVEARVMTKGIISLALWGRGRGFDLGASIGAFSIEPR